MKYKKIIIAAIFIISLLAVSAVNAAEKSAGDIVDETSDDIVKQTDEDKIILRDYNQSESLNTPDNVNYKCNSSSDNKSYIQITAGTVEGYAGEYITLHCEK